MASGTGHMAPDAGVAADWHDAGGSGCGPGGSDRREEASGGDSQGAMDEAAGAFGSGGVFSGKGKDILFCAAEV